MSYMSAFLYHFFQNRVFFYYNRFRLVYHALYRLCCVCMYVHVFVNLDYYNDVGYIVHATILSYYIFKLFANVYF